MRETPADTTYFDLQVNGCYGVDFNADELNVEQVHAACEMLQECGTGGILATVITDQIDAMCRRLANVVRVRAADSLIADTIFGFHIEGPFLNSQPGYVGAHPVEAVRPANLDDMKRLLEAAEGLTRIVTLAPEQDPSGEVTRFLDDQSIVVSGGHCDPDLDTLRARIDDGLSMFTHLGNACPLLLHRHDNIIQRVLAVSDRLTIGFIGDGIHVPYPTLKNFLAVTGLEKAFIVTDGISAAGCGPGTYTLGDQSVIVDETLATWSADREHLVGSASTMPSIVRGLEDQVGLNQSEIDLLTKSNPRRAIGIPT